MVRAAAATAASASISTPVGATVLTVASIFTAGIVSSSRKATATPVSGRGWVRGMSSSVRLAARTPATWATASTSPFAIALDLIFARVSRWRWTSARATAWRTVGAFADTSTIFARPVASTCVNSPRGASDRAGADECLVGRLWLFFEERCVTMFMLCYSLLARPAFVTARLGQHAHFDLRSFVPRCMRRDHHNPVGAHHGGNER